MTIADCSYRRRLMTHIKNDLQNCSAPLTPNLFSVSHRGSAQIYPVRGRAGSLRGVFSRAPPSQEHTTEGYNSASAFSGRFVQREALHASTLRRTDTSRHSLPTVAQGAGYIECDTSVSMDLQLVCRHSTVGV